MPAAGIAMVTMELGSNEGRRQAGLGPSSLLGLQRCWLDLWLGNYVYIRALDTEKPRPCGAFLLWQPRLHPAARATHFSQRTFPSQVALS